MCNRWCVYLEVHSLIPGYHYRIVRDTAQSQEPLTNVSPALRSYCTQIYQHYCPATQPATNQTARYSTKVLLTTICCRSGRAAERCFPTPSAPQLPAIGSIIAKCYRHPAKSIPVLHMVDKSDALTVAYPFVSRDHLHPPSSPHSRVSTIAQKDGVYKAYSLKTSTRCESTSSHPSDVQIAFCTCAQHMRDEEEDVAKL